MILPFHSFFTPKLTFFRATFVCLGLMILISGRAFSQNAEGLLEEARADVGILAGKKFAGRGYQNDGHILAASYIEDVFRLSGLKPLQNPEDTAHPYFQFFSFGVNKIDSASVKINGKLLKTGVDYIVSPVSGGHSANSKVKYVGNGLPFEYPGIGKNEAVVISEGLPAKVEKKEDQKEKYKSFAYDFNKISLASQVNAAAVILIKKKLTGGFSANPVELPVIEVLEERFPKPKKIKSIELDLTRGFTRIKSQNVIGLVEGKLHPDSFLVLSAHYDHLGKVGDAIFRGANDNASGTAMLLSLARFYAKPENQPDYSMVFIAFGGEEAGLVGSKHFVEQDPIIPLEKIRFLLNLDLMGNGDEGIVAVAGKEFEAEFNLLQQVNEALNAVPLVRARKNAPNSDHYWFVEKGVRGFFVYTLGGPPHYHDVYDTPEELKFSKYVEIRKLFIEFLSKL
ncbi:MAG: M28 family peptidase [Bacteroidia bacterium]|nr:M28 family peptidase [Bacteroidia bacterium]